MRWFQHDTKSHRDPFIEWLLDTYPRGYQIFFIVLEMMGDKFNKKTPKKPITLRLKTIMERTRIKKIDHLRTILESFRDHPLNKNDWNKKLDKLDNKYLLTRT